MNKIAALLCLACLACGSVDVVDQPAFPESAVVGYVYGAEVVQNPKAEFLADTTNLLAYTKRALEVGADVWGVSPQVLDGWIIAYNGGWFVCNTPDGAYWTWGCAYPAQRIIYAGPDEKTRCLASVVVHEIGHAVIGDGNHTDPRWAVAEARKAEVCTL